MRSGVGLIVGIIIGLLGLSFVAQFDGIHEAYAYLAGYVAGVFGCLIIIASYELGD